MAIASGDMLANQPHIMKKSSMRYRTTHYTILSATLVAALAWGCDVSGDYIDPIDIDPAGEETNAFPEDVTAEESAPEPEGGPATPLLQIQSVFRNQALFEFSVQMFYSNITTPFVDVYRNDNLQDIQPNSGALFDIFRNYATDYVWYVCEAPNTMNCSNTVGIQFGAKHDEIEVRQNGVVVKTLPIIDVE